MLCERSTGLPLYEPMLYALTELRARNRSASTIQQALRSVMLLRLVLDRLCIDLDARMREGRFLTLGEIEEISRCCRASLGAVLADDFTKDALVPARVVALERARMRTTSAGISAHVCSESAAIRIHYICGYLEWLATGCLLTLSPSHSTYQSLKIAADLACRALRERLPSSSRRNRIDQRQGLSAEARAKLLDLIDPASPDNPWPGRHPRERNALMVRWYLSLGIRRGELLGIRVSDVNFRSNEVLIARRADDPEDPRRDQPNTKTSDRLLALDEDLALRTRNYIMACRRAIKGARKHQYLFVANGSGAPLTMAAVNKIFVALRIKCPDLLGKLSPHVLRHTWNDDFSEVMDSNRVPEEMEKKMRSRLMGWSETSHSAATYTRRHVQRKAHDAILDLQKKLKKGDSSET